MEYGFLNHWITPHNGLLIKKSTVKQKLEVRIPKFVWNSDNPDSNLKKLDFCIQLQLEELKARSINSKEITIYWKNIKTKNNEKKRKEKKKKTKNTRAFSYPAFSF